MDNSRVPPHADLVDLTDDTLVRESSLLPGEVRTPTMIVTLSEAWADVSGSDWAAPGASVWEEDNRSRHSGQTPLTGYGHEGDVWVSSTGSPLLGDDDAEKRGFNGSYASAPQPLQQQHSAAGYSAQSMVSLTPPADPAEMAAAALQAFSPQANSSGGVAGPVIFPPTPPLSMQHRPSMQVPARAHLPSGQQQHPRYTVNSPYNYEGGSGMIQDVLPTETAVRMTSQQPDHYTMQKGQVQGRGPYGGSMSTNRPAAALRTPSPHHGEVPSGHAGTPYVPRLDDDEVAQSIIASAGLPLSMQSLVDYIHGGQPQTFSHVAAVGTTHNARRNYPNLNEPPSEEEAIRGGANNADWSSAFPPQPSYLRNSQRQQETQWRQRNTGVQDLGRFAVQGSNGVHDTPSSTADFRHPLSKNNYRANDGSFVVSPGTGPVPAQRLSSPSFYTHGGGVSPAPSGGNSGGSRYKSESEFLSDLLHFHANFFPPPPPPRVPTGERRNRAELWYHYANKWDISHRLPPPPRTPLPEMGLEYQRGMPHKTLVPYHGDGWLQMGERWFDVTQALFDFPEENVGDEVDFNVVMEQAVLN